MQPPSTIRQSCPPVKKRVIEGNICAAWGTNADRVRGGRDGGGADPEDTLGEYDRDGEGALIQK